MSETMAASYDASSGSPPSGGGGSRTRLEPRVQTALGRELRAMYDDVVSQPVPDRFLDLLEQLDEQERGTEGRGDS